MTGPVRKRHCVVQLDTDGGTVRTMRFPASGVRGPGRSYSVANTAGPVTLQPLQWTGDEWTESWDEARWLSGELSSYQEGRQDSAVGGYEVVTEDVG